MQEETTSEPTLMIVCPYMLTFHAMVLNPEDSERLEVTRSKMRTGSTQGLLSSMVPEKSRSFP